MECPEKFIFLLYTLKIIWYITNIKEDINLKITDIKELEKIAKKARKNIIEEVYEAKSGHPGSSLSCVDILTVLYFNQMNINPEEPKMENRDKLVLSKGHASPALYTILAQRGFFLEEELKEFRKLGSRLQGHPDVKKLPGIDMSAGSLGQGLSSACGMALASKLKKQNNKIYCILGDGELEEGQIWEAAMTAAHYKLDNLCVIIDNNNLQIDGKVEDVMSPYPIDEKFKSFGFEVLKTDGHNMESLLEVFEVARKVEKQPVAIIANTIKGKGVSFMENKAEWHGKAPSEEEYNIAISELK